MRKGLFKVYHDFSNRVRNILQDDLKNREGGVRIQILLLRRQFNYFLMNHYLI